MAEIKNNKENDREIEYYYSRERRLEKASPVVREMYEKNNKRGLITSIAGNKGNFFLLISIIIICFMYFLGMNITGKSDKSIVLESNKITMGIYEEESILLLSIHKKVSGKTGYTGAVDVTIMPQLSGEGSRTMSHRISFTENLEEDFYISLPFEGEKFTVIFQIENQTITGTAEKAF